MDKFTVIIPELGNQMIKSLAGSSGCGQQNAMAVVALVGAQDWLIIYAWQSDLITEWLVARNT